MARQRSRVWAAHGLAIPRRSHWRPRTPMGKRAEDPKRHGVDENTRSSAAGRASGTRRSARGRPLRTRRPRRGGGAAGVGSGSARGSGRARSRRHATPAARPAVPGRNTGRRTGPCPRTMQPLRPRSPDVRPWGKRIMNHPQNGRPLGDRKEHTLTPARTSPNTRAE